MKPHAERGDLEIVRWTHEHGCQLEAVKFFLESEHKVEIPFVIDHAAGGGHLDIVKYVHENHSGGCISVGIRNAAASGHLEIVQFLHENCTEGCAPDAVSRAARNGHLEVVKFLYEKYDALKCTTTAMDQAAANGHLEVLKFLHNNRSGTCSVAAMVGAAGSSHQEAVKFLHESCNVSYSARAMERAGRNGHFEIVGYLLSIRPEVDSRRRSTVRCQVRPLGEIVKLLCDHDSAHGVLVALQVAVFRDRVEIVKLLYSRLQPGQSSYPALSTAATHNLYRPDIVVFLCDNQQREPTKFLKLTVADGDSMYAAEQSVEVCELGGVDWLLAFER